MRPAREGHGGRAARRAVVRWAVRLFRREWREQALVVALLGLAVAAAVAATSVAYNVAPLRAADFGSADARITFDGSERRALQADIAAAARWFGPIDVIAHRSAPVAGSVETVELRSQDPHSRYGARMLRLRHGRYPAGADEIAVTDGAARSLRAHVGAATVVEGRDRTVTGLVENPSDLSDEFALLPRAAADPPESVTVLVRAGPARLDGFRDGARRRPVVDLRGSTEKGAAAAAGFGLATVVLLLISLVAAAGFAVVAQRRLRQLGMLAAVGATEKHVRLALLANGAVIGTVATVIGAAAGLVLWLAAAAPVETIAEHRIDRLDLPWGLLALSAVLAVVTATAAAWWPARVAGRVPIVLALSARPPRPAPARRSGAAGAVLVVAGVGLLALARESNGLLIIVGTVSLVLGVLALSPLAIRALAATAGRAPVAVRLALRDLGRHQARAGAALAAISLALGLAVAVVIAATAAQYTAEEGNLSDRQVLIRMAGAEPLVPERTAADVARLRSDVDRFAATLRHPAVVALDAAVDPADPPQPALGDTAGGRPAVALGRRVGAHTYRNVGVLYLATPALLHRAGLDESRVDERTDVVTNRTGALSYVNVSDRRPPAPRVEQVDGPAYSSAPTSLITPNGLRRRGWRPAPTAWLVEADRPLTGTQVDAARDMAAAAGMTVESRHHQRSLAAMRSGATAAGMLLALGVLAVTVGLIRSEAAGELRVLTATGATSAIRRVLTATTAGALAFLGVLLGTVGAYLGLIGGYADQLDRLSRVPVLHLLVTVVGVPMVAASAGWLLAGREPPSLARHPLE